MSVNAPSSGRERDMSRSFVQIRDGKGCNDEQWVGQRYSTHRVLSIGGDSAVPDPGAPRRLHLSNRDQIRTEQVPFECNAACGGMRVRSCDACMMACDSGCEYLSDLM